MLLFSKSPQTKSAHFPQLLNGRRARRCACGGCFGPAEAALSLKLSTFSSGKRIFLDKKRQDFRDFMVLFDTFEHCPMMNCHAPPNVSVTSSPRGKKFSSEKVAVFRNYFSPEPKLSIAISGNIGMRAASTPF